MPTDRPVSPPLVPTRSVGTRERRNPEHSTPRHPHPVRSEPTMTKMSPRRRDAVLWAVALLSVTGLLPLSQGCTDGKPSVDTSKTEATVSGIVRVKGVPAEGGTDYLQSEQLRADRRRQVRADQQGWIVYDHDVYRRQPDPVRGRPGHEEPRDRTPPGVRRGRARDEYGGLRPPGGKQQEIAVAARDEEGIQGQEKSQVTTAAEGPSAGAGRRGLRHGSEDGRCPQERELRSSSRGNPISERPLPGRLERGAGCACGSAPGH